ncbi:MAG: WD40 repeat domain-containing protein [Myxococcota bacterium]|nr:WD40 repeat domain-containing protein [Myxococcota bacterium]
MRSSLLIFCLLLICLPAGVFGQRSGQPTLKLKGHKGTIRVVSLLNRDRNIISGGSTGQLRVWNRRTGKLERIIEGNLGGVVSMAISPNERFVATGAFDGAIRIWFWENGKLKVQMGQHRGAVTSVEFVSENRLVSGGREGELRLWSWKGRLLKKVRLPSGHAATVVEFVKGRDWMLVGTDQGAVLRINIDKLKVLERWSPHEGVVSSVLYEPSRDLVISAGWDANINLHYMGRPERNYRIEEHLGEVLSLGWMKSRQTFFSLSGDQTIRYWNVRTGEERGLFFVGEAAMVGAMNRRRKQAVTASFKNQVLVWDMDILPRSFSYKHRGAVRCATWVPKRQWVVSCSGDRIELWNRKLEHQETLAGHLDEVLAVAADREGRFLVSSDRGKYIRLWDLETLRVVRRYAFPGSGVIGLAFSHDGTRFVASGLDGKLALYLIEKEKMIWAKQAHKRDIRALSFSPDDAYIGTGSWDQSFAWWKTESGEQFKKIPFNRGVVEAMEWASELDLLAVAGGNYIYLFNKEGTKLLHRLEGHEDVVTRLKFAAGDSVLLSASNDWTIRVWDVNEKKILRVLRAHKQGVIGLDVSSDNKLVLSAGLDDRIRVWDVQLSQERMRLKGHEEGITAMVALGGQKIATGDLGGNIKVWDVKSGKAIEELGGHTGAIEDLVVNKDGSLLASGSRDKTIKVWSAEDWSEKHELAEHDDWVYGVAFSRDGRSLVSVDKEGRVLVWGAKSGVLRKEMIRFKKPVRSVASSANGRFFALATDKEVVVVRAGSGDITHRLEKHKHVISELAFSPRKKSLTVASAGFDLSLRLWNGKKGSLIRNIFGHTGGVRAVDFSSDGVLLATGSDDGTVRIWRVATGVEVAKYTGHQGSVMAVRFEPGGKLLYSGGADRIIRVWDVE